MYIPHNNLFDQWDNQLEFIRQYSFATLISVNEGQAEATQLPLIVEMRNEKIYLKGHFAKANPHWRTLENQPILVLFNGPNAYISPKYYDHLQNVPTWNYVSLEVRGIFKVISDFEHTIAILENTILEHDPEYFEQWKSLSQEYITTLTQEIVAFEIEVDAISGKKKLSQNKSDKEVKQIIEGLKSSVITRHREMGEFMEAENQ